MGAERDARLGSLGDHGSPHERHRELQRAASEKKRGKNHIDERVLVAGMWEGSAGAFVWEPLRGVRLGA